MGKRLTFLRNMILGQQPTPTEAPELYAGVMEVQLLVGLHLMAPNLISNDHRATLAHGDLKSVTFRRDPTQDYWVNVSSATWTFTNNTIVTCMGLWDPSGHHSLTSVPMKTALDIIPGGSVEIANKKIVVEGLSLLISPEVMQRALEAKVKEERDLEREFEKIRKELAREWGKGDDPGPLGTRPETR